MIPVGYIIKKLIKKNKYGPYYGVLKFGKK